jgi:hypothetical protein
MASAAMNKKEDAIRYSNEAFERHDPFQIQSSKSWPDNKYLVAFPEYQKIVEKLKLN